MNNTRWKTLLSILSVLIIVAFTFFAYRMGGRIMSLQRYGYPGIFLIEFIANASVLLPIPGSLVAAAVAPLFNPFLLALVAGLGASLGELSAYIAGLGGSTIIHRFGWYDRIHSWLKKYGGITILFMAAIPNPFFDTAGLAAGALQMGVTRFFFWCFAGKVINRLILVFSSAALLNHIHFFHH
jgi:membrane protein YqaA with SNARE-associated domain